MKSPYDELSNQTLDDAELDAIRPFGEACLFQDGETLFEAGHRPCDFFFIVKGEVAIMEPWTDSPLCLTRHIAGEFAGDVNLLMGRPAIASAIAEGEVEAIRVDVAGIQELMVHHSTIGDKLISAFYRRRELTEEGDFKGIQIFGPSNDPDTLTLREFFYRNGVGYTWNDTSEEDGRSELAKLDCSQDKFPVVACAQGGVHVQPAITDIASDAGIQREISSELYDVTIIGSGPSGLGAAVYAASEGLRTLVLDKMGPGGQAGTSSKIENYAGFPTGLSGRELALRTQLQAIKFGAEITAPCSAHAIKPAADGTHEIHTCLDKVVRTKTVIIATGVSYRHLGIDGIDAFRNRGVYYAATRVESALCRDKPVHIIGGGNSAGQAAMFLSQFTREVHIVIRGEDLTKSMSSYLSDRVITNESITVRKHTEVAAIQGSDRLETVTLKNNQTGDEVTEESCGLFIFIGAKPYTDFLGDDVAKDPKGFVLAGPQVMQGGQWKLERPPCALESSSPGIFTSGDCRSGTTKRVAFAIGDGALAVTCVHEYLGTYS